MPDIQPVECRVEEGSGGHVTLISGGRNHFAPKATVEVEWEQGKERDALRHLERAYLVAKARIENGAL